MNLPDVESLRCFEAAATHLNFRVASEAVALSPSAFSERINRLEELLGEKLFERTTRRVQLTPAGRRLLPEARQILTLLANCSKTARGDSPMPPFKLVLGTRFELGMSWLVPSVADLLQARPERKIDLSFGDSPALLGLIADGTIDAMISSVRLTQRGLNFAPLHRERYVFLGSTQMLKLSVMRGPKDAEHHTLLDMHPELPLLRYFLDARPPGEDWAFKEREHLGTIGAVKIRVLAGAGVAVLPRYFVQPELDSGALTEILPETEPVSDMFRLIWKEHHPLEDELRKLAAELSRVPLK